MIKVKFLLLAGLCISATLSAQPTFVNNDPEAAYKEVRELVSKEQFALAYPKVKALKDAAPLNKSNNHFFTGEDIAYFDILCRLQLNLDAAREDAVWFIRSSLNEVRRQVMSFYLACYYFRMEEYSDAIDYYVLAGYDNLTNDQLADAKFERAYCHFNLKQFKEAKPLFYEIRQIAGHKYYYPSTYYYGFIVYGEKQYDEALEAFKIVESKEEYKGVVPYYITEIYYFQNKKEDALKYGEGIIVKGEKLYYNDQLNLLLGQIYFEQQDFKKAMPLLEGYVNGNAKVSKEVMYELSYCYYKQGLNLKAMAGFKELSNEKDSMGQNSMYLLGDLYLREGQKENARNAFQYSAFNSSNKKQQQVSRFQYAKLSYELGYQDVALKEMKDYLKDYPKSEYESEAREILLDLLGNSNNYSEALALYNSVEKPTEAMQKVLPRIRFGRAVELINEQQTSEAAVLLKQVVSDANAGAVLPYANFWLGEVNYRNGKYEESIGNLAKFLERSPAARGEASVRAANYTTGYDYFQLGNYKSAIANFEKVATAVTASSTPLEQDAFYRLADCYYMSRDFSKASVAYEKIINAGLPGSDYAAFQKAMISGISSSDEKIRLLNGIVKKYPNSTMAQEVNMEIGLTYLTEERSAEAVPYFNRVVESEEESLKPKAYLKLGLAYYNSNNNKSALENLQKLISKYPNSTQMQEAMGLIKDIYVEDGRSDEYVEVMKKNGIVVSVSEADSLSFVSGESKYQSGDCSAAIKSLTNYLSKYPAGAYVLDANFMISDCYRKNKEWASALKGYDEINQSGPSKYFDKATLDAARICYFELKDYALAGKYFESLRAYSSNPENTLEGLRGLVRTYYQMKEYSKANQAAAELLASKGISTDDRSISNLVLGKSQKEAGDCTAAINSFKEVAAASRSSWGAEARYEMAACYFSADNLDAAEKGALSVIKETGAYEEWVTRSYILLGDIFMKQEDYFNAKATFESVSRNASIVELRDEARRKLDAAVEAESKKSRISKP